jgi:hypothetical protein
MIDFETLLAEPPVLKSRTFTLEDGRDYCLHDLPASVLDRVYRQGQENVLPIRDATTVVAQALLGRVPEEDEVERMMERLGSDTILEIFKNALNLGSVTDDNVEAAKKP